MISILLFFMLTISLFAIFSSASTVQAKSNEQFDPKDTDSLVDLARKCITVVKDEMVRGDMAVAGMFINMADQILAQANPDSVMNNNQNVTITITPHMCDWYDPESGKEYR